MPLTQVAPLQNSLGIFSCQLIRDSTISALSRTSIKLFTPGSGHVYFLIRLETVIVSKSTYAEAKVWHNEELLRFWSATQC